MAFGGSWGLCVLGPVLGTEVTVTTGALLCVLGVVWLGGIWAKDRRGVRYYLILMEYLLCAGPQGSVCINSPSPQDHRRKCEIDTITIPILYMRKLRHRKV